MTIRSDSASITPRAATHIVIAGGGFAGLRLARMLARNGPRADAAGRPVRVTLIERSAAFTYTPLLYEVAAAKIAPEHATARYHDLLWDRSIAHTRAEIEGLDLDGAIVRTDRGDIPYDRLVLALGAVSTLPTGSNGSGLAAHALPFMNLRDAEVIRTHLERRFRAAVNGRAPGDTVIAIAGGGPKGVELAFDLADFVARRLAPEYGVPRAEARIVVINGEQRLMTDLAPWFDRAAHAAMRRRGIRLISQQFVIGADGARVRLDDGRTIGARTLIWTAGIAAHPLIRALGLPLADGALRVTASLRLPRYPAVYAAGDCARTDDGTGLRLPATASLAQQHGRFLARALAADLAGAPLPTFAYAPRGQIIKLGDGDAAAQVGGGDHAPRFSGRAAFALRSGFDLLEVPGLAQKRGTLGDLRRRR